MPADWTAYLTLDILRHDTVRVILTALFAAAVLYVIGRILTALLKRAPTSLFFSQLLQSACKPVHLLLPLIATQVVWSSTTADPIVDVLQHTNSVLIICAIIWLAVRAIGAIEKYIVIKNPVDMADNLAARKIQTQTRVLTRSLSILALILGIAGILTTFPAVRQFGTSLLASAGLAGLVVGFAARPVLANLIAGIQIAITQPIRLDDVVIIENEWGRIEEITGTYVVVRIWDSRRLVVPLQWIIENPFQNWTRQTSSIIGTVFFWLDYSVPMDELREELTRLCKEASHLWDGEVCVLQVTDCSERSMQVRALASAADSGQAWDLRCFLREHLLAFINTNYPGCLPTVRAEIKEAAEGKPQANYASEDRHTAQRQPPV